MVAVVGDAYGIHSERPICQVTLLLPESFLQTNILVTNYIKHSHTFPHFVLRTPNSCDSYYLSFSLCGLFCPNVN